MSRAASPNKQSQNLTHAQPCCLTRPKLSLVSDTDAYLCSRSTKFESRGSASTRWYMACVCRATAGQEYNAHTAAWVTCKVRPALAADLSIKSCDPCSDKSLFGVWASSYIRKWGDKHIARKRVES